MALTIDLSSAKTRKLNKHAKQLGISGEELVERFIEFILEVSDKEFESWIETLEILVDKPFTSQLEKSVQEAEDGKTTNWNAAKQELGLS